MTEIARFISRYTTSHDEDVVITTNASDVVLIGGPKGVRRELCEVLEGRGND